MKKLVQKVVSRDAVHYRKLTDKAIPVPGEKEETEQDSKESVPINMEKLAQGWCILIVVLVAKGFG